MHGQFLGSKHSLCFLHFMRETSKLLRIGGMQGIRQPSLVSSGVCGRWLLHAMGGVDWNVDC